MEKASMWLEVEPRRETRTRRVSREAKHPTEYRKSWFWQSAGFNSNFCCEDLKAEGRLVLTRRTGPIPLA